MKKAREAASIPAGILRTYHLPGDIYAGRSVRERERRYESYKKKEKETPRSLQISSVGVSCVCHTTESNPEGYRGLKRARAPALAPEFRVLSSRLTREERIP